MKTFYTEVKTSSLVKLIAVPALLISLQASSQNGNNGIPPGQAAKFGIDGDIKSDERQNGSFTAAGSHDWFKKKDGTGLGLIDTIGSTVIKSQIQAGANIAFSKRMSFAPYSIHDGVLMMDGVYSRDYQGNDRTSFGGNTTKNTASPAQWGTNPGGGNVSDKTDIIDTYVSMRRNGTTIGSNNPSDLIATMALTTFATTGDHYADFEFYKERVNYNPLTGNFQNSGPAATGGHSAWEFNADGSIKSWGDLTFSFSFNNTSVSEITVLIWVAQSAYNNIDPKNFDFVNNEYYGSTSVNGYGYAAIKPNGNGKIAAWGTVSSATTSAPVWGTSSKELGSGSGSYSENYSAGQFAEAALNLTTLGIDPVFATNFNPCNPPFTRFITKSRSSSSFSSSLSDFTGPYEFLDAPTLPANMITPGTLTCNTNVLKIEPANYVKGGAYNWSTANGSITKIGVDNSSIEVNKAGKYFLTAAMAQGCTETLDSVVVTEDKFKPKASATRSAVMIFPGSTVMLIGGDPIASNYLTPFGRSQGLSWKWNNVNSGNTFSSSLQSPLITAPGNYRLIITETRNGCSDTAYTSVAPGSTLPVKFTDFAINTDKQNKTNSLSWKVAEVADVNQFVVEKSSNATDFTTAGLVFADNNFVAYSLKEKQSERVTYYRIKAITKAGASYYSAVMKAEISTQAEMISAFADAAGIITINCFAADAEMVSIKIINMNGQVVKTVSRNLSAGNNSFKLTEVVRPNKGVYVVHLQTSTATASAKINW